MPTRRPPRQPPFDAPAGSSPSGPPPERPLTPARASRLPSKEPERTARPFVPDSRSLTALAAAAEGCKGCDLYARATQVVFGAGAKRATMMLVGEQPGDKEDVEGKPFVGPAGVMLQRALEEAGLTPETIYVTNAVKHFSWEPRGKRRIHKKPDTSEIDACRWWLDNELAVLQPSVVVALGATAARSVMHKVVTINANRGRLIELPDHRRAVITVHPSYLLRLLEERDKRREFDRLVKDLRFAADAARQS